MCIYFSQTSHVLIIHSEIEECSEFALYVFNSDQTTVHNSNVFRSGSTGIVVEDSTNISLKQVQASFNNKNGVMIKNCSYVSIEALFAEYNDYNGLHVTASGSIFVNSVTALHNNHGISFGSCCNVTARDIHSSLNAWSGIYIYSEEGGYMPISLFSLSNVSSTKNKMGINLNNAHTTALYQLQIKHNKMGIQVSNCTNCEFRDVYVDQNENGIFLIHIYSSNLYNVVVEQSEKFGIMCKKSGHVLWSNVSAIKNGGSGFLVSSATYMNLSGIKLKENAQGIDLTIIDLYSIQNRAVYGVTLFGCAILTFKGLTLSLNSLYVHSGHDLHFHYVSFKSTDLYSGISFHGTHVFIAHSAFSGIISSPTAASSKHSIINLESSTLSIRDCNFTGNAVSSVAATESSLLIEDRVIFENITSECGAAFILSKSSSVVLHENSHMLFPIEPLSMGQCSTYTLKKWLN